MLARPLSTKDQQKKQPAGLAFKIRKPNRVLGDDLDQALKFYTEVLGFVRKQKRRSGIQMVNRCLARSA